MSILQDALGLPIFAPCVYMYMVTGDINVVIPQQEIPDPGICHIVSVVI